MWMLLLLLVVNLMLNDRLVFYWALMTANKNSKPFSVGAG